MQRYRARLPVVAAALLVAATILFVIGTSIERSQTETGGAPGGQHCRAAGRRGG